MKNKQQSNGSWLALRKTFWESLSVSLWCGNSEQWRRCGADFGFASFFPLSLFSLSFFPLCFCFPIFIPLFSSPGYPHLSIPPTLITLPQPDMWLNSDFLFFPFHFSFSFFHTPALGAEPIGRMCLHSYKKAHKRRHLTFKESSRDLFRRFLLVKRYILAAGGWRSTVFTAAVIITRRATRCLRNDIENKSFSLVFALSLIHWIKRKMKTGKGNKRFLNERK